MNWIAPVFLGIAATAAFTIVMQLATGLRFTRMNFPFIFGTLFTANRFKAIIFGLILHFLVGVLLAFVYFWFLLFSGWLSIWFALVLGILQGLFVMTVGCAILPACHPRMADENYGPQAAKLLEPPGFLGMNYGFFTPLVILVAHSIFGLCLGLLVFFK
jgi:hypothetical protein